MKIEDMRVKVESDSQMKIAMIILQEISGKMCYGNRTPEEYMNAYPRGAHASVGVGDSVRSWNGRQSNEVSFTDFLGEAAKALKNPPIKITAGDTEHIVEFKDNGVQVGCTFVPKGTVEKIYKKLFQC